MIEEQMPNNSTETDILPMQCYVPFLFAQKHKLLLLTILSALMLFYVNLGLPYRVRHREERYHYIYWFA